MTVLSLANVVMNGTIIKRADCEIVLVSFYYHRLLITLVLYLRLKIFVCI